MFKSSLTVVLIWKLDGISATFLRNENALYKSFSNTRLNSYQKYYDLHDWCIKFSKYKFSKYIWIDFASYFDIFYECKQLNELDDDISSSFYAIGKKSVKTGRN